MKSFPTSRLSVPLFAAACAVLMAPALHAAPTKYLTIGDTAPALKPRKWIKGTPVPQFEKGQRYVVEFWATWCVPCRANIPHLTKIARDYKGDVSVIGVDIWENVKGGHGDYLPKVTKFVGMQGAKMDYTVATDTTSNTIAKAWVDPAGEKGLPCSFIVDKNGKIAWIGYPTEIDAALAKMKAGTYNVAAEREKRETEMRYLRPIDEAMTAKNYRAAAAGVEKASAHKPKLFYGLAVTYLTALYHCDLKKGIAKSNSILNESHEPGAYQMIGSIFATQNDLSPEAYRYGVSVLSDAERRWPADFMYTAMKANAVFSLGKKAEAIQLANHALGVAKSRPKMAPEIITLIQKNITRYKAAK